MYESRIMKPIKNYLKKVWGEYERVRGGEFDQSTLYACMCISL
jgi:hypothetical protein